MRHIVHTLGTVALALLLGVLAAPPARAAPPVTLVHVHGLSYSADGKRLLIPSHDGLAVYAHGRWSKMAGPANDYMGMSATRDAIYSSGHPAPGSMLANPFGLIKSRDGGQSWQQLGLEGQADFHTLATGYASDAVYVVNHQANARMDRPGIYSTLDDGLKWQRADAKGLGPNVNSLAVHPTDAKVVAAGAEDGLYLSRDSGNSFERLVGGEQVLAEAFDLDAAHLWFSAYAGKPALFRIGLTAGAKAEQVALPPLTKDAVAFIAQNPVRRSELVIATFQRSVYLSNDRGRTWTQIAHEGATL